MTKAELIKALEGVPDDAVFFIADDMYGGWFTFISCRYDEGTNRIILS